MYSSEPQAGRGPTMSRLTERNLNATNAFFTWGPGLPPASLGTSSAPPVQTSLLRRVSPYNTSVCAHLFFISVKLPYEKAPLFCCSRRQKALSGTLGRCAPRAPPRSRPHPPDTLPHTENPLCHTRRGAILQFRTNLKPRWGSEHH